MSVSSFEIKLERESGVFYAGEVVRGTVRLVTTADIKTRGVRVRYRGEGFMHYHTGSGDNRHDYEGKKIYEEHRYTMFGNYYNTSTLDNAGADAIFGSASGDGIMYIPCKGSEPLELIVRVMDYDFGKRDDLLGEIVLNVSELVASGAEQSFPLTRFGRPEKGEVTLTARMIPLDALFPSSRSSTFGGGKYDSICELRAHKATGLRKADFIGKNDVYVQAYRIPASGVDRTKTLPSPDKNTILPAGTLEFPFAFPIRPDAPGTAELRVGDWAFIRYTLYANIDIAWWLDPSVKRAITVIASHPKPPPQLLYPIAYNSDTPVRMSSCCCFPCLSGLGTVVVKASLARQVYAPGEVVDLRATLKNDTSSPMEVTVELVCTALLRTTTKMMMGCHSFTTTEFLQSLSVDAGDSWDFDGTSLEQRVPAIPPSFFGASGMATAHRDPVTFSYQIGVRVKPPGTCVFSHSVFFPLMVSAVPPSPEALNAAQSEDRAPIQQATPAAPADLTGPAAARASAVASYAAAPRGRPVPAGALVNTFHREEDTKALAPPAQQAYQPHILTFSDSKSSSAPPIPASHPAAAPVPSPQAVSALVTAVQTQTDKRWAVTSWATEHPGAGAGLTPQDVKHVLQAVSLSMDQACVALEVARCMGPAHLTCAHVVAACEACAFFKTEVALAMAPYIGDGANKQVLLQVLPSYDRARVEQTIAE